MPDWERIERYRNTPFVQQSIREAHAFAKAVMDEARRAGCDESTLAAFTELEPQGKDIPFVVFDERNQPVAIAKVILREDAPDVTGYLAVNIPFTAFGSSRNGRRRQDTYYIRALQLACKIAFTECGLTYVYTYLRDDERKIKTLRSMGFTESTRIIRDFDPAIEVPILEKRVD